MAKKDMAKNEDSMEEILHSIRDIVSAEPEPVPEAPAAAASPPPQAEDDVLELTSVMKEEPASPEQAAPAPTATAEPAVPTPPPPAETPVPPPPATEAAAAPAQPAQPAAPAGGDVLAEIDQALGTPPAAPATEQPAAAAPPPPPPPPPPAPPAPPPPAAEAPKQAEPEKPQAATPAPAPDEKDGKKANVGLVSDEAAKATMEAMKKLVSNIPKTKIDSPELRSGTNVEEIVVEALKPMLSAWLNENLPTLVKQIVEKEVKKLIPREE